MVENFSILQFVGGVVRAIMLLFAVHLAHAGLYPGTTVKEKILSAGFRTESTLPVGIAATAYFVNNLVEFIYSKYWPLEKLPLFLGIGATIVYCWYYRKDKLRDSYFLLSYGKSDSNYEDFEENWWDPPIGVGVAFSFFIDFMIYLRVPH